MPAKDVSMSVEEFKRYYDSHRGIISSVKAYDAVLRTWVGAKELFDTPGAYTLIVTKLKDNSFIRVNVTPSLAVSYSPGAIKSPGTWKSKGIDLTYEEQAFLESLGTESMSLDSIISKVEASGFDGKARLTAKLKRIKR
jgi:hypothetical protein